MHYKLLFLLLLRIQSDCITTTTTTTTRRFSFTTTKIIQILAALHRQQILKRNRLILKKDTMIRIHHAQTLGRIDPILQRRIPTVRTDRPQRRIPLTNLARDLMTRIEMVPLPIPHRLMHDADRVRVRHGPLGAVARWQMRAVDAPQAHASGLDGGFHPALLGSFGNVLRRGAEYLEVFADEAEEIAQPVAIIGYSQQVSTIVQIGASCSSIGSSSIIIRHNGRLSLSMMSHNHPTTTTTLVLLLAGRIIGNNTTRGNYSNSICWMICTNTSIHCNYIAVIAVIQLLQLIMCIMCSRNNNTTTGVITAAVTTRTFAAHGFMLDRFLVRAKGRLVAVIAQPVGCLCMGAHMIMVGVALHLLWRSNAHDTRSNARCTTH
mmetsp:Transcript_493/g.844  ORF Transcript_493/g.844 Transcript_493/m.844 type:complete len:377 (-) Transcript_493:278-1408(-)